MDLLYSLTDKPFPFLLLSSLLFLSSFIFATENNSNALSTHEQCIEEHFSALLHLKQGFNFSDDYSMTTLSSWNPDNRDCCFWEGITCDSSTGHVIGLDLSEQFILGQIDSVRLFRLQSLQRLNLAFNYFRGCPIPSGFEQLTGLTYLNLSSMHFYGQIPLEISRLTTLVSFDLSFNEYDNGSYVEYLKLENPSIGELVQNLSSLRELYLDYVKISAHGTEWGQALSSALPLLHKLSLCNCNLSGPIDSSLSKLHFLSELYLTDNNLSSAIPNSIFRLPNLQILNVGYNPLLTAGEIPPNNTLQGLVLSNTEFCREPGDSFINLVQLTMLVLRHCKLSGPFPSSLVMLRKLMHLDLSFNDFKGPLPSSIANLSSLVSLDLSNSGFSGPLPPSLANLSNLVYLDLSSRGFSGSIPPFHGNRLPTIDGYQSSHSLHNGTIPSSLFSLPSLKMLVLSGNQFSGQLGEFQNASSSPLESIYLDNNELQGPIPRSIFQLPNLAYLSLSSNNFSGPIPSLYGNQLHNCRELHLSRNSLSGNIPSLLFSLPSLWYLTLHDNQFSGQLGESHNASSSQLRVIDLSTNSLSGNIPSSLFSLPSLRDLNLQGNQFSGKLGEFQNASSSQLEWISLSNNSLQGPIPRSIFALTKLYYLSLSSNSFSCDVDLGLLQNLKYIRYMDLSDNHFSVSDSRGNSTSISFPKIKGLSLRSCNISKFPDILRSQEEMYSLDLSNNKINGEIPNWIWKVGNGTLNYLNLSHNALEGLVPPLLDLSISSLQYLDLSFNKLEGSIPIPPLSIRFYSLSSNNFSGEVPLLFCNAQIEVFILSDNRFNGSIPPCLSENNIGVTVLNLGGNAFQGILPKTFKEQCTLETLDLSRNRLEGQVPRSLANCKELEVLNLGNNQINDTFPFQLENFPRLRILILRSNKFHGTVGQFLATHTSPLLQIIDLSSNSFTGNLPSNMFKSWKAMMEEGKSQSQFLSKDFGEGYYQDKVTVVSKGLEMELVKILTAFTIVDFSNNQFYGDIPKSIGDLKSLHGLNMSFNHLTGRIPASIGNIKDLESLDLSRNNLSGEIPPELTKLTFLGVLNLSQNHLVGSIPQSNQFFSFTDESFQGNLGLCGPQLSKKCENTKVSLPSTQLESQYDWKSLCIGFGVGYGVGMGILFWTLALWTKGKREYIMFIDKMLL